MPAFADYYRRLGVGHFLVDRQRLDRRLMDWAAAQPDVSVWHTGASYRASRFGMLWVNDLLRRHGAEALVRRRRPRRVPGLPEDGDPLAAGARPVPRGRPPALPARAAGRRLQRPAAGGDAARRGRRPVRGLPVLRPRRLPAARELGQLDLGAGRPAAQGAFRRPARAGAGAEQDPLRALAAALPLQHVDPRRLAAAAEPGARPGRDLDHRRAVPLQAGRRRSRPRPPRRRCAASITPPAASTRATAPAAGRVLRRGAQRALRATAPSWSRSG